MLSNPSVISIKGTTTSANQDILQIEEIYNRLSAIVDGFETIGVSANVDLFVDAETQFSFDNTTDWNDFIEGVVTSTNRPRTIKHLYLKDSGVGFTVVIDIY